MKRIFFSLSCCLFAAIAIAQSAPKPYGVLPTERQLRWQEMEMYVIMHFTPTTFQNKEWGFGDADPAIFNPSNFNADKIFAAIKAGGFKGLTLVAKHHDGFALWPTKTTPYNISASPFRGGKGDLVKEMMDASKKAGLAFGLYCSPWDRNNPNYSKPAYVNNVYHPQLKELYTNYGKLYTVFFDGANGGDGYYGGAKEKRSINASDYYDFEKIWGIVRSKQASAVVFSDIGPDIRWVGNERGEAGTTSWATFTPQSPVPGKKSSPGFVKEEVLPVGTRNGAFWIPAECDVPLRPGWFYHPEQDGKTKTPIQLLNLYYKSVGRGASLDLGIAPMPSGELHPDDIANMKAFGDILRATFATNFAHGASISASNTRAKSILYTVNHLTDNDRYSYWATDDNVNTASLEIKLQLPSKFNVIRLRENIKLGQRIEAVGIDTWDGKGWNEIATATSIGGNRLIRLPKMVETQKLRLRIVQSPVSIALSDFALFAEPESVLVENEKVAAADLVNAKKTWKILPGQDSAAIDGNATTWTYVGDPKREHLLIDFQKTQTISIIDFLPRQDGLKTGMVDQYLYEISLDGQNFSIAAQGEFSNIANNPVQQSTVLKNPTQARFLRISAKHTIDGSAPTVAEIGIR